MLREADIDVLVRNASALVNPSGDVAHVEQLNKCSHAARRMQEARSGKDPERRG